MAVERATLGDDAPAADPRPGRPRVQLPPAGSGGLRAAAAAGGERGGERPRICILPTASGDTSDQIASFYSAFGERSCEPSDVSLFRLGRRPMALRDHLLAQDLIYVGGGSLLNLLAVWEAHDIASILSLAWRQGIVLAGQSAGAMCWFEAGITKSSGRPLAAAGLGLLTGSLCVHYNNEPERRAAYLDAVGDGMPGGYGLDDYAGLLWEGEGAPSALTARRGARAYRVSQPRGRGGRVAAAGPLSSGPRSGGPARGHRRVPPHQDDAQTSRLARLKKQNQHRCGRKNYFLRATRRNFLSTVVPSWKHWRWKPQRTAGTTTGSTN